MNCFSHRKRKVHQSGFTLIELLVALAILGLLTSLGASMLHLAGGSWQKANKVSANTSSIASVQRLLRDELARARLSPADKSFPAFDGRSNSLTFTATLPEALSAAGPTEIRLQFADNQFIFEWYSRRTRQWNKSILFKGIADARFTYLGAYSGTRMPSWHTSWADQKTLPAAIRLDIGFAKDDGRSWPQFIVNPMINTDLSCLQNSAGEC